MTRAKLQPGEVLLAHGAAGGVSLAAVELGRLIGAIVIAVASTAEKRDVARARGANHVLDPATGPLALAVKELTHGHGADVIYDPVGGTAFDQSFSCIAWGRRLLVIGFASGTIPTARVNRILMKGCSVIGVRVGEAGRRNPSLRAREITELLSMAEAGHLRPHVHEILPLDRFVEAMGLLGDKLAIGRVVLTSA